MPIQLEAPVQPKAFIEPEDLVKPETIVQEAEETATKSIDSDTKSDQSERMVMRRTMTVSHFFPGVQPAAQQQPPQGSGQTPPPPPPPSDRSRKRQRTTEQTPAYLSDAPTRTPPWASGNIIIREPTTQTGMNVASTSRPMQGWQPSFQLDGKPLLTTTNVLVWEKGEGGRVAQSLVRGLLLPEDMHAFKDKMDESLGRRLQWHTIAVISCLLVFYQLLHSFCCTYYSFLLLYLLFVLSGRSTDSCP